MVENYARKIKFTFTHIGCIKTFADASKFFRHLQEWLQLSEYGLHEVSLSLGESPHAAGQQLLCCGVELGKLVQQLGVESLVVVPRDLQLVLNAAVFEAVGALLAVVVVQQFVEALLDEFVWPSEHEQQLGERVDDQDLCALLLLRE